MARTRRPGASIFSGVVAAVSVVVLYIWDDVLLAGPVVAATAFLGALPAFLLLGTVYTLASFVLAMAGVRAYDRFTRGEPSRLARWLGRQRESRRAGWAQRLLDSGKAVGFVVSSFLLGGIVTTFLVRYGGRTHHVERVAFLSSVIFGITFTGAYTGLAHALFRL